MKLDEKSGKKYLNDKTSLSYNKRLEDAAAASVESDTSLKMSNNQSKIDKIRSKAVKLLRDCNIDPNDFYSYPIDVKKICEHLGYDLISFTPKYGKKVELEDGRIVNIEDISGAVEKESNRVHINTSEGLHRARFTCAHEIGHIILEHENPIDFRLNNNQDFSQDEREANIFAASLLMPGAMFRKLFNVRNGSLPILSRFFKVSYDAIAIRARELGLDND